MEEPNKLPENGQDKEAEELDPQAEGNAAPDIGLLTGQIQTLKNELLYQRADFENYKKRSAKEQEQAIRFSNERLIRELLTVLDLLERGLEHGQRLVKKPEADKEVANFVSGIEMTHRELVQVLGRFSVELIGTVGERFDPNRHEAVSQVESDAAEDTVMQVLQKGCLLHGRLLSPARVVVGKAKGT